MMSCLMTQVDEHGIMKEAKATVHDETTTMGTDAMHALMNINVT